MADRFREAKLVEERRIAVLEGREEQPKWDVPEPVGGFYLAEAFDHPEQPPLLSLSQVSENGEILGEIWLRPADLAPLIEDLRLQLRISYAAGDRRWLGKADAPRINMGIKRRSAS
jgi:hypothetical protein